MDNVVGNLILDSKDILKLSIVAFRPQMIAVGNIDELRRHPQPVARFAYAAFQHSVDLQLASDLADVLVFAFKEKEEVRDATRSALTLLRALMISSAMPSLKNSFSGSLLILTKASTAMLLSGTLGAADKAIASLARVLTDNLRGGCGLPSSAL